MFVIRPAWLSLFHLGYFSLSDSGSVPILLESLQQCPKWISQDYCPTSLCLSPTSASSSTSIPLFLLFPSIFSVYSLSSALQYYFFLHLWLLKPFQFSCISQKQLSHWPQCSLIKCFLLTVVSLIVLAHYQLSGSTYFTAPLTVPTWLLQHQLTADIT